MSFFKKLFGKRRSKEEIAEEFLLSYKFEKAVNLREIEDAPVDADVLISVIERLAREGKVKGRLVGKKGWFLPGDKEMFSKIFSDVEQKPIDIAELSKEFGLNKKRTVIALKDQAGKFQIAKKLIFHEDKMYSIDYLRKRWRSVLNNYDLTEEDVSLEDVLQELEPKELYKELVQEWMLQPKSPVVLLESGILKLRADIGELIAEKVKALWDEGANEIPFSMIAKQFGVTVEEAGDIILRLVNDDELQDVTVYSAEELIKRRSSH